jgi:hypothetical protein
MAKKAISKLTPPILKIVIDNLTLHGLRPVSDLAHDSSCQCADYSPRRLHQCVESSFVVAQEVDLRLKTTQERESIVEVTLWIYRVIGGAGCTSPEAG